MIAVQIESTNNNFSVSVVIKDYCQYTSYIVLRSLFSCHHVHKQTNISFKRCENERILKITNNTNFDDWERQRDLDVAACKYVFSFPFYRPMDKILAFSGSDVFLQGN